MKIREAALSTSRSRRLIFSGPPGKRARRWIDRHPSDRPAAGSVVQRNRTPGVESGPRAELKGRDSVCWRDVKFTVVSTWLPVSRSQGGNVRTRMIQVALVHASA